MNVPQCCWLMQTQTVSLYASRLQTAGCCVIPLTYAYGQVWVLSRYLLPLVFWAPQCSLCICQEFVGGRVQPAGGQVDGLEWMGRWGVCAVYTLCALCM